MSVSASIKDTEYGRLQIYDVNNTRYIDKEMSYGKARAVSVKLYVKSGMKLQISTEGNFGDVTLYKLT